MRELGFFELAGFSIEESKELEEYCKNTGIDKTVVAGLMRKSETTFKELNQPKIVREPKRIIKQLLCRHDWKTYAIPETGPLLNIRGEKRILACPRCKKIKKRSEHMAEYEGRGFK